MILASRLIEFTKQSQQVGRIYRARMQLPWYDDADLTERSIVALKDSIVMDHLSVHELNGSLDITSKKRLATILSCFPPEFIDREFGRELLVWVHIISNPWPEFIGYIHTMRQMENLARVMIAIGSKNTSEDYQGVKSIIRAHEMLISLEAVLSCFDLGQVLRTSGSVRESKFSKYSLDLLTTDNVLSEGYDRKYRIRTTDAKAAMETPKPHIWLDVPLGITVLYRGMPQAVACFLPKDDGQTLLIHQLQRVRPYIVVPPEYTTRHAGGCRGLFNLDAEGLMIKITEALARAFNFAKIGILSGRNNSWINKKSHIPEQKAVETYDGTADRLGFHQERDTRWKHPNWYRNI